MIGLERRAASETNNDRALQAKGRIDQVQLPSGGASSVRTASVRHGRVDVSNSVSGRIASGFYEYASGVLDDAAAITQERSMLDGAMAQMQGKAFEDVKTGGDKWALEGFRVVEAQSMASSLLVAQREEIANGGYEQDPDKFRAAHMDRAEAVLKASSDPRVADMAREQLLKQMPVLVEDHMTQNVAYKERKNAEVLEKAVGTLSLDSTSADALVSFARGGDGSATAGLSEDKRLLAVTAGVVRAFNDDNPSAYAVLANAGVIKELPVELQQQIMSAKRQAEQRARDTYNPEYIKQSDALMEQIALGEIEPQTGMDMQAQLMADHGFTMTQQEAGVIYSTAKDGVENKRVTTAMAAQEAFFRGDRETTVRMLEVGLTGTESSGNTAALNVNPDGRRHGGLLQFGALRLKDYENATGIALTPDDVRGMTAEEQRVIGDWHINDVLNHIEEAGYDNLVGTSINGVEVTVPGLVAVAHLGGQPGLDEFIKTKGGYNPKDSEGTHLTDYLRIHGTGVPITPEAMKAAADARMYEVRKSAAVSAYEAMQPELDKVYSAFSKDGDVNKMRESSRALYEKFGAERTIAVAQSELEIVEKFKQNAQKAVDDNKKAAVGDKIDLAARDLQNVLDKYGRGEVSAAVVEQAQQKLTATKSAVSAEYGVPLDPSGELAAIKKQRDALTTAMEARLVRQAEQATIDYAVSSGSAGELPVPLQERAIKQAKDTAIKNAQAVASSKRDGRPAQAAEDVYSDSMSAFYAKTGLVDAQQERVMNGYLSQGLLDSKGEPRKEALAAVHQYVDIYRLNPSAADKYVRPENRAALDAIVDMLGDTGAQDNMEDRVAGAVRTVGIMQARPQQSAGADAFVANKDNIALIDDAVKAYVSASDIGVLQAVFTGADLSQVNYRPMFSTRREDDASNTELLKVRITEEVHTSRAREPGIPPTALVRGAARRVQERTPIIGGTAVAMPMSGPSAVEVLFGARAQDFSSKQNVVEAALTEHMLSDEFQKQYPFAGDWDMNEFIDPAYSPNWGGEDIFAAGTTTAPISTIMTGLRPYVTYYSKGNFIVEFELPTGGYSSPIVLDTKAVSKQYLDAHTQRASGK